ncbi:hypothetical protein F442_12797 [Phytophthora nicotianae P10297]|uniref:Uncharacterized protein n=1 Tax=Phytophthora nicotianae P10297 TaxID=1317064 RepID=W2YYA0_PHYNI|nr:hypothetical protein F442_12797 [Phytophthora nicotianae P10297]
MATPTTPLSSGPVQPKQETQSTDGVKCIDMSSALNSALLPRKKRVRRIQAELPLYRQQVHDLELQLTRYKLKSTKTAQLKSEDGRCNTQNGGGSLWNEVAERQLKERLRAERQQAELKESYNEFIQCSTELRKLLTRAEESKRELMQCVQISERHKFWDLSIDSAEIFSDQLVQITRLYLEAQQRQSPSWSVHFGSQLSGGRDVPKLDPTVKAGVILEARCSVVLPFDLKVATDAYWRFFRFDHSSQHFANQAPARSVNLIFFIPLMVAELTHSYNQTNLFARSFALRTEVEGYSSETEGRYTCRKYVGEDDATLVWSGMWNILKLGHVRFDRMQLHKQGFIKLRRLSQHGAAQTSTSTLVETSFETIPVFHNSVRDYKEQTKVLITSLSQSHDTIDDYFCRLMSDILLEEDWKSTFGQRNTGSF